MPWTDIDGNVPMDARAGELLTQNGECKKCGEFVDSYLVRDFEHFPHLCKVDAMVQAVLSALEREGVVEIHNEDGTLVLAGNADPARLARYIREAQHAAD